MKLSIDDQKNIVATKKPAEARRLCADIWVNKKGLPVEPASMDSDYLLNTIGMLIRQARLLENRDARTMFRYAANAPDGAADAANEEASALLDVNVSRTILKAASIWPVTHALGAEAVKRGLDWHTVVIDQIKKTDVFVIGLEFGVKRPSKIANESDTLSETVADVAQSYKPTSSLGA